MGVLETNVDAIDEKLAAILSLLQNPDGKKGEKVVARKCTPESFLRNDDDVGNDGRGSEQIQGSYDVALVTSNIRT